MMKKVWNIANCNKDEVGALLLDDWEPYAITISPAPLKGGKDVATYWLRKQVKVEVEVEEPEAKEET